MRLARISLIVAVSLPIASCGQSAIETTTDSTGVPIATTATSTTAPSTTTTERATTTIQGPATTTAQATTTTPEPENATLKLLDVIVWDDTVSNPPDVEVWVEGHGNWFPELTFGGDGRPLGEFPVGVAAEFLVYPDGRGGTEIRVPFLMTEEVISGSDRDKVSVAIEDDKVVVFGTPIVGLEIEFDR